MKHSRFYNSIINFLNQTDRKDSLNCNGVSTLEIETLEFRLHVKFPELLTNYLLHFGRTFEFYSFNKHEYFFSFDEIRNALEIYQKFNLESVTSKLSISQINSFIPLLYDEMRSQMVLLDANSVNGRMYLMSELYFSEDGVCDPDEIELVSYMDFFQNIQERLFLMIKGAIRSGGISSTIDVSKIDWCKFHIYYHRHPHYSYNISFSRKDFHKEYIKSYLDLPLTFSEYEREFIRFLIKNKDVPPIPEIYNVDS